MSAPSMPPDNSLQVEQARIAAQERQKEQERVAAEQRKQELAGLRTSSAANARNSANSFFGSRGLDSGEYSNDIDSVINGILGGISPDDPNPGSYFNNIGETAYNTAEGNFRNKSQRDLDRLFAPNFETQKIPFTLDDPYLASIEAEQRAEADSIIRNMLDRGVITGSGYAAAGSDLDKQAPGVRSRLNEVGTTTLAQGQQGLKDVANRGRQTAGNLTLGTAFDPYSYGSEADQMFTDFISSLGDSIRAKTPGNLFQTAGLGAIAGAGQGAQNTIFDPNALSGITDDEKKKQTNPETIF